MSLRILTTTLAACLAMACSNPAASTVVVATEGGTIQAGTTQFVIPPNALATDTEVVVASSPSVDPMLPALEGVVVVVELEPEGTVLEVPATITVSGAEIGAGATDVVGVFQLGDGVWAPQEFTRDETTGDVSLSVTYFSPVGVTVRPAPAAGGISGTLSWGDGSPASSAPVQLFQGDAMVGESTTDANGAFSFTDLDPGSYAVRVNYECMVDQAVEVAAGMTATLELTLCGAG